MKNKLSDLNNYLFEELERLNDEELCGNNLDEEIKRATAISNISKSIVCNANVQVKAIKLKLEYGINGKELGGFIDAKNS